MSGWTWRGGYLLIAAGLLSVPFLAAQPGPDGKKDFKKGPPQERKILKQFDKDNDGRLNKEERQAARQSLKKEPRPGGFGPPGGGFGPPGGFGGKREQPKPGIKIAPGDATPYPNASLYDPKVLRTVFLDFDDADWEAELADFHNTDVEVPATLTVDGKKYPNVGVHFRGMSSYMAVPAGFKRSLNLSLDFVDTKQRLYGYKTLNLLNSHDDPSLMSTVLFSEVSRSYIPAPKANYVKVVINGEYWGVYVSAQQFNKDFLAENYKTSKGARWKVRGSPGAGAGLEYMGDNIDDYRRRYTIKSGENEKDWQALIALCKTLHETPPEKLEAALAPILDLDGVLWFLALDATLINCDGYWIRASDYCIYRDDKGKFHTIAHDMNEAFRPPMGPGFGGPPGGGGGPGRPGGFGGFGMRPPQPGEVLPGFLQDALQLSDDQKKKVSDLQKEIDGKLAKILNGEQIKKFNEMRERGPGGFGPPGMGGGGTGKPDLDPLVGLTDKSKPLRSKLLAVPSLKTKYLKFVGQIAQEWLDWKKLGPVVAQYRELIEKDVQIDTRKLDSIEDFKRITSAVDEPAAPPRGKPSMPLRVFAEQRRQYLLSHAEVKKAMGTE